VVWLARILAAFVAIEHVYILVLEMLFWNTSGTRRAFGIEPALARETEIMAANQGLYNGFLAGGIAYGLCTADAKFVSFFLGCVVVAGLFGGYTVKRSIYLVQAFPALLALVATRLAH
jgi:putative membrane protein